MYFDCRINKNALRLLFWRFCPLGCSLVLNIKNVSADRFTLLGYVMIFQHLVIFQVDTLRLRKFISIFHVKKTNILNKGNGVAVISDSVYCIYTFLL